MSKQSLFVWINVIVGLKNPDSVLVLGKRRYEEKYVFFCISWDSQGIPLIMENFIAVKKMQMEIKL